MMAERFGRWLIAQKYSTATQELPFEPTEIAQHLTNHSSEWVAQCAATMFYASIHAFGYDTTVRAFEGRLVAGFLPARGGPDHSHPLRDRQRHLLPLHILADM